MSGQEPVQSVTHKPARRAARKAARSPAPTTPTPSRMRPGRRRRCGCRPRPIADGAPMAAAGILPPAPIDPDLPSQDIRIGYARCSRPRPRSRRQLDALTHHLTALGSVLEMLARPRPVSTIPPARGSCPRSSPRGRRPSGKTPPEPTLERLDTPATRGRYGGRPLLITDDMLHTEPHEITVKQHVRRGGHSLGVAGASSDDGSQPSARRSGRGGPDLQDRGSVGHSASRNLRC